MKTKSNKVRDIRDHYLGQLAVLYPQAEAASLFDIMLEGLTGITKMQRIVESELRLSESEMLKVHFAVKDLMCEKPVQYILGFSEFYGLRLEVNKHVLIPRPETEELVAWIVEEAANTEVPKILDIGTGSGAIALAIKDQLPSAVMEACDISDEALKVAGRNAATLNLDVCFSQIDILNESERNRLGAFDVIVSNPPYVRQSEKAQMRNNVLKYEPGQALFVSDDNPLLFYKVIIRFAQKHLLADGSLYFEINENYGDEISTLLISEGFKAVELRQDIYQRPRMVRGKREY